MDKPMKILWQLINTFGILLLTTTAKPIELGRQQRGDDSLSFWQHVSQTCLSGDACDHTISVQYINTLLKHMNASANPCNDFHAYACGNWQSPLPQQAQASVMKVTDDKVTDNFVQLFERLLREKRKRFLEQPYDNAETQDQPLPLPLDHSAVYEKLLKYYSVCKETGRPQLSGYFEELAKQGAWQLAGKYNWLEGLTQVTRYGNGNVFLTMDVKQLNATQHIVRIFPGSMRQRVHLSAEVYAIIKAHTSRPFSVLHAQFQQLEADLSAILAVACVGQPLDEEGECDLMQMYTLHELQHSAGEINWRHYLQPQMGEALDMPHLRLHVDDMASIKKIARYLDQADSELLRLYTLARFANYLQSLPVNIMQLGATPANCIRHVRKLFHQPMTFLYESAYYSSQRSRSEPLIHIVFNQLKQQLARTLQRNRLRLSASIVAYMQQKLQTMRINVGNLPLHVGTQFYVDYVRQLNVSDNFYRNHLQALQHAYAMQRALVALRPGSDDASPWHTLSYHAPNFPDNIDQTAYYFCLNNMIILPHAYMQLPFYHYAFWPALIYGDLATTLGHELMHAFDLNFLPHDSAGNYIKSYHSIEANEGYRQIMPCIRNDTDFMNEQFADLTGTRLALDTFLGAPRYLHDNGRVFFLQFAQFFCGGDRAPASNQLVDLDRLRLNDALAQMPEFAAEFNCPVGSAMNPVERCETW